MHLVREFLFRLLSPDPDKEITSHPQRGDPGVNPQSYRKCVKCGFVKLLAIFPLVQEAVEGDWRRHKICRVCLGNRLAIAQKKRGSFDAKKARIRAWSNAYRFRKSQATPKWVDHDAIEAIYWEAQMKNYETGVKHQVDHIIPLKHHLVCGLHIPGNLRVITATENIKKKNKWVWTG